MRLTIAYSKIKKRNLVLINNDTHQRETVSERPIRSPLKIQTVTLIWETYQTQVSYKNTFIRQRRCFIERSCFYCENYWSNELKSKILIKLTMYGKPHSNTEHSLIINLVYQSGHKQKLYLKAQISLFLITVVDCADFRDKLERA